MCLVDSTGLFHIVNTFDDGGELWIMDNLDLSKPDTQDIVHIGECFARMGCKVKIPHPLHFKSQSYKEIFGGLAGTKYERKCPDILIDGHYYEYESYVRPWNKRKLSNMLSNGLRQSDRIIIDNREGSSLRHIMRAIRSRLNVHSQITEVWIYNGDSVIDIYP